MKKMIPKQYNSINLYYNILEKIDHPMLKYINQSEANIITPEKSIIPEKV